MYLDVEKIEFYEYVILKLYRYICRRFIDVAFETILFVKYPIVQVHGGRHFCSIPRTICTATAS